MNNSIDILLSTYNGEKYIDQQIDSILGQSETNWRLLIRDDGSTDATLSILSRYIRLYPDKLKIITDTEGRLGPALSYGKLLNHSDAMYVSLCDQDDVWLENRLKLLLEAVNEIENKHGADSPVLVHSDLRVVDDGLDVLAESFWKYQKLNPAKMQYLSRLLVQNCVTGCATMVNRSLVEYSLPVPANVIMHDWWLALVAISCGNIASVNSATINYRQHISNELGAKRWGLRYISKAAATGPHAMRQSLYNTKSQAESLLHAGILNSDAEKIVQGYVEIYGSGWLGRRLRLLHGRYYKYGFLRNLVMFLLI